MNERTTHDLAADVRHGVETTFDNWEVREKARAALDALVARVTDLEAQVAALTHQVERLEKTERDLQAANDRLRNENRVLRRTGERADA